MTDEVNKLASELATALTAATGQLRAERDELRRENDRLEAENAELRHHLSPRDQA